MTAALCRAAAAVFDKVTELVLGDQPNAELVALFEERIGAPVRCAVDELEPVAVAAGCSTPVTCQLAGCQKLCARSAGGAS